MSKKMRNIILIIVLLSGFSCNKKLPPIDHNKTDFLILDSPNCIIADSSLNEPNSLKVEYYNNSIRVFNFYAKRTYVNDYILKGNVFVDYRKRLLGGVDTIPFLTKCDTTFIYDEFKDGAYVPFLLGLNKQAAQYIIKKLGKLHIRILHSLTVPSYYEKYYYDDKFHIIRFEFTYKKNRYVYRRIY